MLNVSVRFWVRFVLAMSLGVASLTASEVVERGHVVELRQSTQAMRGSEVSVTIPEGERFEVRDVKNGWLLGRFDIEGQKVLGWVRSSHVHRADHETPTDVDRLRKAAEELASRKPETQSLGMSVTFSVSDDRRTLALVTDANPSRIHVIDLATGETTFHVDVQNGETAKSVRISKDLNRLVALTESSIAVWDVSEEPQLLFRKGRRDSPGSPGVTVLLRGSRAAVVGHGQGDEVTVLSESGEVVASFHTPKQAPLRSVFGPTGRSLAVFYGEGALCWEDGKEPMFVDGDTILNVCTTQDGRNCAIRTREGVMTWQLEPLNARDQLRAANLVGLHLAGQKPLMFTPRNPGSEVEVSSIEQDGTIAHVNTLNAFWDLPITATPSGDQVAYVSKYHDRNWSILLTPVADGTWLPIRLFRLSGEKEIEKPVSIQLADDAKTVATRDSRGRAAVWDVASGHAVWQETIAGLTHIWLHPSGETLLAHTETGELLLCRPRDWGIDTTRLTLDSNDDGRPRKYTTLKQLHFSRSGHQVVAVTSAKKSPVAIYATHTGKLRHASTFKANRVEFTAGAERLYMIGSKGAGFCDPLTGRVERVANYRLGGSWKCGERPVFGRISVNRESTKVLFDPVSGLAISRIEPTEVRTSGLNASSPDGALMAFVGPCTSRSGYGLEIIDVASGKSMSAFPLEINSYLDLDFTADGRFVLVATSGGVVKIDYRKRESSKLLSMLSEPTFSFAAGGGTAAAAVLGAATELGFSGNETHIVDPIRSMDVTTNGWIFTGHVSGTVTVWDATTGEKETMIANPPHSIDVLSVSENGRWLACGPKRGGVAYLLDLRRHLPHRDQMPVRKEAIDDNSQELTLSF